MAWKMVPRSMHIPLKLFLRSVRSLPADGSVLLRLSDGGRRRADLQKGLAVFLLDRSAEPPRGWILVRDEVAAMEEDDAVLGLLHELTHAVHALWDAERLLQADDSRAEFVAWLQAAVWVTIDDSGTATLGMAMSAVERAMEEQGRWLRGYVGDKLDHVARDAESETTS